MNKYLLIESRDAFGSRDQYQLAQALAGAGNDVTLLLVQNAVLPARRGADASALAALMECGVKVLADDFSLRERAIADAQLLRGVARTALDLVIDHMTQRARVVWQ